MQTAHVLRVAESLQDDVGHGKARIDTKKCINMNPGDVVSIKGKTLTTATVWKAYREDEDKPRIRIDGLIRKNAGAAIGDEVIVQKIDASPATKLILAPRLDKNQRVQFGPGVESFVHRILLKRPLTKGDTIIVPGIALMGGALPFIVMETQPEGIVQINESTEIVVKEKEPKESNEFSPKCYHCETPLKLLLVKWICPEGHGEWNDYTTEEA